MSFRMERENLFSDAKGQTQAAPTARRVPKRGGDGAARSSEEGSVMELEQGARCSTGHWSTEAIWWRTRGRSKAVQI
jgi:hypothetical protein